MVNKMQSEYGRGFAAVLAAVAGIVIVILIAVTLFDVKNQISYLQQEISQVKEQLDKEVQTPQEDKSDQKEPQANGGVLDEKAAEEAVWKTSAGVIEALKNKDMKTLSGYVHPDKGVRFSPYAYVEKEKDVVLTAKQIEKAMESSEVYLWGNYDGSGEPIELKFSDYYDRFVYDSDFESADYIGFNKTFKSGNTINNAREVYPEAIIVEYHIPYIDPKYEGMDWRSLRLVFEEKNGVWYLTGIIHDEWTI